MTITGSNNSYLHRPYGGLVVESERRRDVAVGVDLRRQIGDAKSTPMPRPAPVINQIFSLLMTSPLSGVDGPRHIAATVSSPQNRS
jgi:hypothetical protein